jgi:2-isopropylmalate synthase
VDRLAREVSAAELRDIFWREYIDRDKPYILEHFKVDGSGGQFRCRATILREGQRLDLTGQGNGPIAAFVDALQTGGLPPFEVAYYSEHALSSGAEASAIAYIQIKLPDGRQRWGAGVDTNIELASIKAVVSALNRTQ